MTEPPAAPAVPFAIEMTGSELLPLTLLVLIAQSHSEA
jgi:hypothetical protein